ncbi:hypothetical protein OC835_007898, partial [Tilletia horrida]
QADEHAAQALRGPDRSLAQETTDGPRQEAPDETSASKSDGVEKRRADDACDGTSGVPLMMDCGVTSFSDYPSPAPTSQSQSCSPPSLHV